MLLFFLLALIFPFSIANVCNNSNFFSTIIADCQMSALCVDNFYLTEGHPDEKLERFQYLVSRMLHTTHTDIPTVCANIQSKHVWMNFMKHYEFCHKNEVFDIDKGCVCHHRKQCKEKSGGEFRLSPIIETIVLFVLLMVIIYYSGSILLQLKNIHNTTTSSQKDTHKFSDFQNKPNNPENFQFLQDVLDDNN